MHSLVLLDSMVFRVVGICSFAFFVLPSLYTSCIVWGLAMFCQYIVQLTYQKKRFKESMLEKKIKSKIGKVSAPWA